MEKTIQKTKKKISKKQRRRIFVTILFIGLVILLVMFALDLGKNDEPEGKKVVDEIKKFSYTVSETDPKLFKERFKDLKKTLSSKEVDNKEYARLISELFIIDFYTLDNKRTKNDVGGVQFVYESYKSDFVDKARDGIYKQVKSNLDDDRNQNLPLVQSVEIVSVEEVNPSEIFSNESFKDSESGDAYQIKLKWTYKNDDDFQKEATVIVVKDSDKLSVAKLD